MPSCVRSMVDCQHPEQAVSNGVWQGDNPVHFAVPLLIIQISLVLLVTRSLAWLLKPLRQPRVIAEIIGGVILGPSVLGRINLYSHTIFPQQSLIIIDTVANVGLLFFLFMVGLELDLNEIRRTGKRALLMAMSGIAVPFLATIGVARLLNETISNGVRFAPLVVFMGVPISITAFPVLVRILGEHKLLTTDVGQMVLPAAAINDVCAWILLALGVALAGSNQSPLTPTWVLLCGIVFVIFMLIFARRFMSLVVRRVNSQETVNEIYVCATLIGVLIAGFTTDAIGIHPLFGAFVFGLVIPNEGTFGEILTEKIEDFVTTLMLPLFFASSGLKTNLGTINSGESLGLLIFIFATAAGGKVSATWLIALTQGTEKRKALAVGFLMNTKGLVELIILNIGKDLKVLNDQTFAILVLMCLLTTFITTPVVMALYKPTQTPLYTTRNLQQVTPKGKLRILACVHGTRTIRPIINFIELIGGSRKLPTKAYILHLMELSERPSSLMMLKKAIKLRYPKFIGSRRAGDQITMAFEAYGLFNKMALKTATVVSELEDIHEDVCRIAAEKRATFIILPFHKCYQGEGEVEITNPLLRKVNQKILQSATCSVGIIMDRGLNQLVSRGPVSHRIALLFFGGPDDREAVALGCQLVENLGVTLTVFRLFSDAKINSITIDLAPCVAENQESRLGLKFLESSETYHFQRPCVNVEKERFLDDECLSDATKQHSGSVVYEEHTTENSVESVIAIAKTNKYNLFLVGRGQHPSQSLIATQADKIPTECSELGLVGDVLAAEVNKTQVYSVIVVQHYDSRLTEETACVKMEDHVAAG